MTPIGCLARSHGRAFLVLFLLGFSVRVGTLRFIPQDLIAPNPDWETGAITLPLLDLPQRAVLLIPLLTYSLAYYVVAYMPRYGYPVYRILFLMAGGAFLKRKGRRSWTKPIKSLSS